MGTYVQQVPVKFKTYTVVVGTPKYEDVQGFPFPLTVTAIPGDGGTMAVAYSTTPNAAGSTGTATWIDWPSGAVATTTSDSLLSPVAALRFTATTANGTVEVNG
jgi:hypothetical protein